MHSPFRQKAKDRSSGAASGSGLGIRFSFILSFFLLVWILRQVDLDLMTNVDLSAAWMISPRSGVTFSSLAASSVLSLVAIVFSISLVVMQLANLQSRQSPS